MSELEEVSNAKNILLRLEELEEITSKEGFWNDQKNVQVVMKEIKQGKEKVKLFNNLTNSFCEIKEFLELVEEDSLSEVQEIEQLLKNFEKEVEEYKVVLLYSEPEDISDAIMEFHPGAGGTESQDFAQMLYRMHIRFAEKLNYKVELIDYQNGDEAGIKSVTILVKGPNAYGTLKSEKGVHRLVRISPFDSSKKRHTSFASVDVMPSIEEDVEIVIKEDDLKIDTFRSGGAGGQSVNTTDSAVRITHKPTGIVVNCQNERSQIKNREQGLKLLKSKLYRKKEDEKRKEMEKLHGEKLENSWGSQIRSYVLHPYSLVKDHRTNYESGNPLKVLDGDLIEFSQEYLKYIKK